MARKPPWKPWHEVVRLRDDVRTGELSLADFAADLHDVVMQKGSRPVYEDPARFFALTYPTFSLRELARDVVLRLAGKNTKAVRQLELTYGGGKTHTLITLRHLVHDPPALPVLPAVEQFKSHIGTALPQARVAALCFDKLDVEKGMEVRAPSGELRWLKHPWSVLAFQVAGPDGLRILRTSDQDEERETAPAEPLLYDLLSRPQAQGLATLVLIDEVLMYARAKAAVAEGWSDRLLHFFQSLCQAVVKVDRCALVASLLASDPAKADALGKELSGQIFEIFNRQKEEGVLPVQKEDVAEVLRRRFFDSASDHRLERFRPHVTTAVANIAALDESSAKGRKESEERFLRSYPFHPDLTDVFYSRWTQLDRFQRTRGILRTFAIALRDAEKWDLAPLVGPNVFLSAPGEVGEVGLAESVRELAGVATREVTEGRGNDWSAVLEGELAKARMVQTEQPVLSKHREIEQSVCAVFLCSQPIGQKANTPELMAMIGTTRPDRIELEKGLRRWTELSWFLDESEFDHGGVAGGAAAPLPKAWRLGNRPNLKQMHHDACANRVSASSVEQMLLAEVPRIKSLTDGARAAGARVHMLPSQPRDIQDDGNFHLAILRPSAAASQGQPSGEARRFLEETTGPDRPRTGRNAVVLVAPSHDGLHVTRDRIRALLGWKEVQGQLKAQEMDPGRQQMLSLQTEQARKRIPAAIRQAWSIVVTANEKSQIHAFKVTVGSEPLFTTIKADRRARIQDDPINAEAMLPGGPYDLWREGEPSRRVKDLVGAFAENPKLPKMLRRQEILDTIDLGVRQGIFVALVTRPDKSVRTWWRVPINEAAGKDPALELVLPEQAELSELHPELLVAETLPGLWGAESISVADVAQYFAGGKTVWVKRDGYDEPVGIPACPQAAVEKAIAKAVEAGSLLLVSGPSSFQGESVPGGVLTGEARLYKPLPVPKVNELTEEGLPTAWKDKKTTALALSIALATKFGRPYPWPVLQQAIDDAIRARWIELAEDSGRWPCDSGSASVVKLTVPRDGVIASTPDRPSTPRVTLNYTDAQELLEVLPSIVKATAGVQLRIHLQIELQADGSVDPEMVRALNKLLAQVTPDLRLPGERGS